MIKLFSSKQFNQLNLILNYCTQINNLTIEIFCFSNESVRKIDFTIPKGQKLKI